MSDGRIDSTDLENGILMLQHALWSEYRDVRLDDEGRLHLTCMRCKGHWIGDSLSHPEHHGSWCPLSWAPDLGAIS